MNATKIKKLLLKGEKMKLLQKKYSIFISTIMLILIFFTSTISSEEDQINICCTNSILADFTKNLLKEVVNIEYIMPPGACPMHFDTSPSDLSKIKSGSSTCQSQVFDTGAL